MAKDAKPAAEGEETAAAPKKSKKLLIIIIAAVVLLLIVGVGAFLLMSGKSSAEHGDGEVTTEKPAKKKKGEKEAAPAYVALDVFTVNLVPEQGDQFLQLVISVEVDDPHAGDKIKQYMPKLRNKVMLLLSDKKASELITKEGKQKLAEEIRDQMNEVLDASASEGPIKEVLFTSFIIQ